MNFYATMARDHWAKWLPKQLAELPDPEAFFAQLGEKVAADIDQMATDLAGPDPGGEDYLTKVGRLRMARFTAKEIVLRDQVLLPPESPHSQSSPEGLEDYRDFDEEPDSLIPTEAPWLPLREPAPTPNQQLEPSSHNPA